MKPGERIKLIEEATDSLASRPLNRIQLHLREFGIKVTNWDDYYTSDIESYCTDQLADAEDDALRALHEFLLGDDAGAAVRSREGSPWGTAPTKVFISHLYERRHLAGETKDILGRWFGMDAFVAHDDIHPSKTWREVIKDGLRTCDFFVAMLDDGYHASQWCDQEAGWALARGIPIMPVRPRGFDRSTARDGWLEEHQDVALDQAHGSSDAYWLSGRIFDTVLDHKATHDPGVQSLAEAFVTSPNYDFTRKLWTRIEREPVIASEQLRRLEYAVQTNRQVYDANVAGTMVPDLVRQLVEKFEPPKADPWAIPPTSDEPPF